MRLAALLLLAVTVWRCAPVDPGLADSIGGSITVCWSQQVEAEA